jgi:hypothetical protein
VTEHRHARVVPPAGLRSEPPRTGGAHWSDVTNSVATLPGPDQNSCDHPGQLYSTSELVEQLDVSRAQCEEPVPGLANDGAYALA